MFLAARKREAEGVTVERSHLNGQYIVNQIRALVTFF